MNMPFYDRFKRFTDCIFFSENNFNKTYFDFSEDVKVQSLLFKKNYQDSNKVVVKNPNQYLFLVEVFSLWSINKIPILISPKATETHEKLLLKQINADAVDDEALILFTSGSTDTPKGVALTFSNLISQIESFTTYFKATSKELYLLNLPLHHVGGLMLALRAFLNGGHITTQDTIQFSYISLVPHQLELWMSDPTLLNKLQKSKAILIGGAAFKSTTKDKALKASLPIFETYGMTETTSFIALNGEILPNREIKISHEGIISIKGPMLAAGIYKNKQFIRMPEWFETSDKGAIDHHHNFSFLGRIGSTLISGGENISAEEINQAVLNVKGVKSAYTIGIPDEKWGDLVTLLYDSDFDLNSEIEKQLSHVLHPFHIPKYIFNIKNQINNKLKISNADLKEISYNYLLKKIFSYSYFINGEEKPTIVLLHGFMETKEDWNFLAQNFSQTHNFLLIDLPGHGTTEINLFSSLNEILTRLRDFVLLFTKNPIFLGYSMGGRLALQLSENYLTPDHLILISASLGLNSEKEKRDRLKNDSGLFNKISDHYLLEDFFRDWYSTPMFLPYSQSANYNFEITKKSTQNYKNWEHSLIFFSQGNFPLKKTTEFKYPVFYISGSEDEKYSNQNFLNHTVITGAGHNPHKTHQSQLLAVLANIL